MHYHFDQQGESGVEGLWLFALVGLLRAAEACSVDLGQQGGVVGRDGQVDVAKGRGRIGWRILDRRNVLGVIQNFGGEERFQFSMRSLEYQTGLSAPTIVAAKWELHRRRIIKLTGEKRGEQIPDSLYPNEQFYVRHTDIGNGRCYLDF